jgi:hypothetical protein
MEETLQTLGGRMDRMDLRFEQMEDRFERLSNETLIGFEQVQERLTLILERIDDFVKRDETNVREHSRIDKTLGDHDLRILALEHPDAPKRRRTARTNRQKGGK